MVRTIRFAAATGIVLCCATMAAAQRTPGDTEIITNYWHHLSRLLEREQAAPVPEPPGDDVRFPPPKQYSFDVVQHLNAAELRRAAIESIKDAKTKLANKPRKVVDRQIETNVLIALQYYPLAATRIGDFQELLAMLEDGTKHPVLRRIILERLVPGLVPPSLLGDYLVSNIPRESDRVSKIVGQIATSPIEDAAIQVLGMEVLYRMRYDEYVAVLNTDANVRARADAQGAPVMPLDMTKEDAPALTKAVEIQFNNITGSFASMAKLYMEHHDPLRDRPAAVKAKARELVRRILDTVPLPDPDAIEQLLAAA